MWRVHGTERQIGEGGLAGCLLAHRGDVSEGSIDEIFGQVVAGWAIALTIEVVVVLDQVRMPLARVALEEAVVALEAKTQWPRVEGARIRALVAAHQVPLADRSGGPSGVSKETRSRRR